MRTMKICTMSSNDYKMSLTNMTRKNVDEYVKHVITTTHHTTPDCPFMSKNGEFKCH